MWENSNRNTLLSGETFISSWHLALTLPTSCTDHFIYFTSLIRNVVRLKAFNCVRVEESEITAQLWWGVQSKSSSCNPRHTLLRYGCHGLRDPGLCASKKVPLIWPLTLRLVALPSHLPHRLRAEASHIASCHLLRVCVCASVCVWQLHLTLPSTAFPDVQPEGRTDGQTVTGSRLMPGTAQKFKLTAASKSHLKLRAWISRLGCLAAWLPCSLAGYWELEYVDRGPPGDQVCHLKCCSFPSCTLVCCT